ncbi:hypothetical protein [Sphingobium yanoikuyae]|uniref:hypothetical protein n=1 Tax=Sphingobium yanoikuyae TaxID=13690 RepID=UPI0013DF9631|nr:hypothetical protein [Sphingobium yanoikuyae]
MKGRKPISFETTDLDQEVLRELVRLLARQAAAEHVRDAARYRYPAEDDKR